MSSDTRKGFWEVIREVGIGVAFACAGVMFSHEVRLVAIESSRYTPAMALERERAVNQQIDELERQLSAVAADISVVRQILEDRKVVGK